MRKTVVILLDVLHSAGAENVAVTIAAGLKRSDEYRPIVCATRGGGDLEEALRAGGIEYILLRRKRSYQVHKFLPLKRIIRKENVQIIHAHKIGSNLWGALMGRLWRVPVIAHVHGQAYTRINLAVDRLIAGLADRLIAVSERQRRRLVDGEGVSSHKISMIHNGIDYRDYKTECDMQVKAGLGVDGGIPVVGISSGLRSEKRHETFLLAARDVLGRGRDARFLVVGGGPRLASLKRLASRLGISAHCVFVGHVRDLSAILSVFDVGVLSSQREGLPLTLLQYMASAKPIVATNVGGVPEAVHDGVNGFVVPPGDHEALASRVVDLLDDRDLAREMGKKGLAMVKEDFSAESMINSVKELYASVIAGRSVGTTVGQRAYGR